MPNSRHPDFEATDPEGRKITMASDDKMIKIFETDVYKIFCMEVLEYDPNEILVTDSSLMTDFPEDRDFYISKVKEVFNVDVSDMESLYIWEVIERIVDSRVGNY